MSDKLPTVNIKGSEYTLVKDRILFFNKEYPNGSIITSLMSDVKDNRVVVLATVTPDIDKPSRYFRDYAQELIGESFINKTSALENASTSAIGRALALMGIGVIESTGTGIASADEVVKATNAAKNKDLNRPTQLQKDEIVQMRIELGIKPPTADDSSEWSEYCASKIQAPYPQNQEQAAQLIAMMQEDVLDMEAKRAIG